MSEGRSRMMNSRWANSFCLSECELIDDNWVFYNIEMSKPDNRIQLSIEFNDE